MDIGAIFPVDSVLFFAAMSARLVLACLLGGLIGFERESVHRPAGFRTHTLVCVGSALVMVTSEYIFKKYSGHTNIDPARLGAQVISGIGFLGAGTIIREGLNVKGLTTAASLWAVSCVGIAAGIGYYEGAIAATVIIYATLILLKRVQGKLIKASSYRSFYVQSLDIKGRIGEISGIMGENGIEVKSIEFMSNQNDRTLNIRFQVRVGDSAKITAAMDNMQRLEGIIKVYEE